MTAITTKSRQMRLDNCALNTPKRVQIAGNLRENACKDREAATPADAANAGLENNGKIRQIHPNTKLLGKCRIRPQKLPLQRNKAHDNPRFWTHVSGY